MNLLRPDPGAGLVLLLERLFALQDRVSAVRARIADRENLPGVNALLDGLDIALGSAARQRRDEGAEVAALLQAAAREEAAGSAEDAAATRQDALDIVDGATVRVGGVETEVGVNLSAMALIHGHDFDMLIRPLRRMVQQVAPDTEVVFQPTERTEYQASDELIGFLEQWAINSELEDAYGALQTLPRVVVIEYPSVTERDVLSHAHVAHEVAHIVLRQPDERHGTKQRSDALFDRHFEHVRQALQEKHGYDPARTDTHGNPHDPPKGYTEDEGRLRRWLLEFAADALAIRLVGPWFFFGLAEFAYVDGRWRTDETFEGWDTHPHLAWRLRCLGRTAQRFFDAEAARQPLDAEEWLEPSDHDLAMDVLNRAAVLVRDIADSIPDERPPETDLERRLVDAALDDLHGPEGLALGGGAREMLGAAEYKPHLLWTELAPVWNKLIAGIPPAERIHHRRPRKAEEPVTWRPLAPGESWAIDQAWSVPFDWRTIANVGFLNWLLSGGKHMPALGALGRGHDAPSAVEAVRQRFLERLEMTAAIRGSIELAELLRQAQQLRRDSQPLERGPHPFS